MKNKNFIFFGLALFVVMLDQITKFWVSSCLSVAGSVPVIKNFFYLAFVKNFGIGFGLVNNPSARWILVFVTAIIIIGIIYYYREIPDRQLPVISASLVLGGAIGNLIDRLLWGFVIDFLDFQFWPAFNVADSAITIGVFGLIIYFWREKKH